VLQAVVAVKVSCSVHNSLWALSTPGWQRRQARLCFVTAHSGRLRTCRLGMLIWMCKGRQHSGRVCCVLGGARFRGVRSGPRLCRNLQHLTTLRRAVHVSGGGVSLVLQAVVADKVVKDLTKFVGAFQHLDYHHNDAQPIVQAQYLAGTKWLCLVWCVCVCVMQQRLRCTGHSNADMGPILFQLVCCPQLTYGGRGLGGGGGQRS
jgi:hypothetical protein